MRMLLEVKFPTPEFNVLVKDGSIGQKMGRILEELKPEAVYFTEHHGHRAVILIVNMTDAAQVPAFAEPFFLLFNAKVKFHVMMTPDDLKRAGLEELGKKWS